MSTWVPPKFAKMGFGPIEMDVLLDTAKLPEHRRLPSNLVYDKARSWLADQGLIHLLRAEPELSSFSDHWVLSSSGIELYEEYKSEASGERWLSGGHLPGEPRAGDSRATLPSTEFQPFTSWKEVLDHAQHRAIWYQVPLNPKPVRLWHESPTRAHTTYTVQARTIRITPPDAIGRGHQRTADPFTANKDHLDRFFWKVGQ